MSEFYKKRKGTTNEGFQYENLHVANIVLDLVQDNNVKNFHLSSNDDTYGDFDDVVVDIELEKGREIYALQLKHKKSGSLTIAQLLGQTGHFAIEKYFKSFNSCKTKTLKYLLCTNLVCQIEENRPFKLQNKCFEIKLTKVIPDHMFRIVGNTEFCYKFVVVEENSSEEAVAYRRFFDHFFLYTNQENVHQLQMNLTNKFKSEFLANQTELDLYLKFITNWGKQEGRIEKLNKKWMQGAIALVILSSRIKPFSFGAVNDKIKFFQKVIDKFDVTVFKNDSCEKVIKLWGDTNTKLKDRHEINKLCAKFQISDTFIHDLNTIDVYVATKILWLTGKCPLIVEEDGTVQAAINLCPNQKFVLLEKNPSERSGCFRRLTDLGEKSSTFDELIEICACSIQGKDTISLRKLAKNNREFLEAVSTDDLLEMVVGVCNIGGEKENLPEPYIDRFLAHSVIKTTYLGDLKQETVSIVDCVDKIDDLKSKQNRLICLDDDPAQIAKELSSTNDGLTLLAHDDKLQDFNSTIYYSNAKCDLDKFLSICDEHKSAKAIHHFRFTQNDNLERIRSKGDVDDLQEYETDHLIEETKLFSSQSENLINLIVADPGMGKSELMKSFKNNCSSDLWTVIVSPKDVLSFCEKIKTQNNSVETFEKFLINEKYKSLNGRDKLFYQNCIEQNRVIYIWDALDEITDEQRKIVIDIIVKISLTKRIQWVTSRCHLKKLLESELSVVAFNLTQFSLQTQKSYIEKRLKIDASDKNDNTVEKIQSTFVLVEHKDILGIPLQLFMITELVLQDKDTFLAALNKEFILTDLYSYFIEKKIKIYLMQKENVHPETRIGKSFRLESISNLEKLALRLLFTTEILKSLNYSTEVEDRKCTDCIATGLVTDFSNQIPRFFHNSFAEYLVAVYFSKNHHQVKSLLTDLLFKPKFINVRFFFDLLLAKNHPILVAVLYKNINFLKSHEDEIKTGRDEGGRNALHLACSWGQNHPVLNIKLNNDTAVIDDEDAMNINPETKEYDALLDHLLNFSDVSDNDILLGSKPLWYARKSNSLLAEIKLIKKQGIGSTQTDEQRIGNILYYACLLGYDEALSVFLRTQTRKDVMLDKVRKRFVNMKNERDLSLLYIACHKGYEDIVRVLVASGAHINHASKRGTTPLHIATREKHEEVVKLLVTNGSEINVTDENCLTPLYVASRLGDEHIVRFLVANGSEVNLGSKKGFTPLNVASEQGHENVVQFLVTNGSQVNLATKEGCTPLYIAAERGHEKIVQCLVANGSEVNFGNKAGFTPLYIASKKGHQKVVEFLVAQGSQVNLANKDGFTPLYVASQHGHKNIVEFLVANGSKVNRSVKGFTPLYIASEQGHEKVVQCLIDNGSQVNLGSMDGFTPLYIASKKGHQKVVEFLVAHGSQVNLGNKDDLTPLYIASRYGHKNIVEFLVANGSKVNQSVKGFTPLYVASQCGHKEVVQFLVANGSEVNLGNKGGYTPLYFASEYGQEKVVEFLVANGSQVNLSNKNGYTPLRVAAFRGHKRIVQFLVANGAQVDFVDEDGLTPLHVSSHNGHQNVVQHLVGHGSQVNLANNNGSTPLYMASRQGHQNVVEFLLANGSQVDFATKDGFTPLYIASKNGHQKVVEFLVANGSQVNLADNDGSTPLHIAAQEGYKTIVEYLVKNGAQVNLANKTGLTPLQAASVNGHVEIVTFLAEHGAKVEHLPNCKHYKKCSLM